MDLGDATAHSRDVGKRVFEQAAYRTYTSVVNKALEACRKKQAEFDAAKVNRVRLIKQVVDRGPEYFIEKKAGAVVENKLKELGVSERKKKNRQAKFETDDDVIVTLMAQPAYQSTSDDEKARMVGQLVATKPEKQQQQTNGESPSTDVAQSKSKGKGKGKSKGKGKDAEKGKGKGKGKRKDKGKGKNGKGHQGDQPKGKGKGKGKGSGGGKSSKDYHGGKPKGGTSKWW